jgi:hypothetical protein
MVAPLLPLAMMSMMPGMMPGMGLAMGAGSMLGGGGLMGGMAGGLMGGAMSGIGKGVSNLFGGDKKSKDLKFDKVTIGSVEIKDVSIGNLTIDSMDKDEGDLGKEEKDKGEIVDKTLTSDLEKEGSLTEKGLLGGMEDSLGNPIEGMTDSNSEMTEMLQGKSSFGGGFPELTADTGESVGWLESIAGNTKILEDMFKWANKDEEKSGVAKGFIEGILSEVNEFWKNLGNGFMNWIKFQWEGVKDIAKAAWTVLTTTVEGLWRGVTETVQGLWKGVTDIAKGAWTVVTGIAEGVWTVVTETVEGLWRGVTETVGAAWKGITDIATGAWTVVKETAGALWDGVKTGADAMWEGVKETADGIWKGIKEGADGIWTGVKEGFDKAIETASSVWHELKSTGFQIWDKIGDTASNAWQTFTGGIADIASSIFGEAGDTVIQIPMAKDLGGDVVWIRDTLYDIRDILKDWSSWTMGTGKYTDPWSDTDADLDDFSIENPVAVIEEPQIVPTAAPEHLELTDAITENVAEKAVSSAAAGQPKSGNNQGAALPSKQSSGFKDRDLDPLAHPTSTRGMTPSYTKAPPPPRGNSNTTIDEVRSYLKFPNWRTRMG